jgi:signal transduction histidine kinase/ActR/RegA family two-component response regulator
MICIKLPDGHPYDSREEETLVSIANTFAGILQRKRMTEEKEKLEQHLRQTQKMEAIGTLSGGIAHDFNNILSPIIGFAELARLKLSDDNPAVRDIEHVINAGNRAKELVKQILSLSRQTKFELKPIQFHTVLKEALKLLRSTIPTTIEIKTRIEDSETTVLADSTQIHQIIMNLCTNAYHAMRRTGGILNIVLEQRTVTHDEGHPPNIFPGEYIVLSVQDTGTGMTRSIMEKIFDPYFTTKNKDEGTGLGLSVIQGIVSSYGGHIAVSSEPGIGSCFEVYIPGMTSEQAIRTDEHSIPLPGGTEHILVVDDEEAIASMITSMLRNKGYTVTACTNSTDALRTFRDRHTDFSLVITDMTMPQMTGVELARRLIDFRPDIPLILCTGFSEMIDEKKAEMLGFCKYLMKPVNMKDLYLSVRETIDRSQMTGEGRRIPASALLPG